MLNKNAADERSLLNASVSCFGFPPILLKFHPWWVLLVPLPLGQVQAPKAGGEEGRGGGRNLLIQVLAPLGFMAAPPT